MSGPQKVGAWEADSIGAAIESRAEGGPRALYDIADDIRAHWPRVSPAAAPYLEAMGGLLSLADSFGLDDARGIVARFLGNAAGWRGDHARRIKGELRAMLESQGMPWEGGGR